MRVHYCECGAALSITRFAAGDAFSCGVCGLVRTMNENHSSPPLGDKEIAAIQRQTTVIEADAVPDRSRVMHRPLSDANTHDRSLAHYRILSRHGAGSMGVVYKGYDTLLERTVALKVLPHRLSSDEEYVHRFQQEARAMGGLAHPNIIHAYYVGEDDGNYFFAMEFVEGRNLDEILSEQDRLDPICVVDYMLQVARGLDAACKHGMIHRDIKPSNLILNHEGTIKIADFGLAKETARRKENAADTQEGVVVGTPLYMSPEQAQGLALDFRTDIYSLGATAFHLLTGEAPFDGTTPMEVLIGHIQGARPTLKERKIPGGARLDRVLQKMLAVERDARYGSYQDLIRDLDRLRQSISPTTMVYAGLGTRLVAFLVDAGVLALVSSVSRPLLASLGPAYWKTDLGGRCLVFLVFLATFLVYEVCMHVKFDRSLGKMMGKIYVMDAGGTGPPSIARVVLRFFLIVPTSMCVLYFPASPIPRFSGAWRWCYVAYILLFFLFHIVNTILLALHPRHRGIHDLISGTVVVAKREVFQVPDAWQWKPLGQVPRTRPDGGHGATTSKRHGL